MKKNCNIIKDLLPLYIDKVCSQDTETFVDNHLKDCNDCQKVLYDLNAGIVKNSIQDKNIFVKFVKKMNFKIWRNALIIVGILLVGYFSVSRLLNTISITREYDENIKVIFHDDTFGNGKWNFQIDFPTAGWIESKTFTIKENNENINIIFITEKSTLNEVLTKKEGFGTAPDIDYKKINLNEKMRVYYTTDDLDKIQDVKETIKNSTLIFENITASEDVKCTMNDTEYNYSWTYYTVNKQIISSVNDDKMPEKLIQHIYSINGDYDSIWFPGDNTEEIFDKVQKYFRKNNGNCTIERKNAE